MGLVDDQNPEQGNSATWLRLHAMVENHHGELLSRGCGSWAGMVNSIELESCAIALWQPIDEATGQPCAHATFEPVVLHKALDASSPHLLRALVNQEMLRVVLNVYRRSAEPQERWEHLFTFAWEGSTIESYEVGLGDQGKAPVSERVGVRFRACSLTHEPSGVRCDHGSWPVCLPD